MLWLCAVVALLLSRAPAATGTSCGPDPSNIQLDLPDEEVYTCTGDYIPLPRQVVPSIASMYEQEKSSIVCMDTAIVYTAAIPNSGAHRPTWAKYGEYIYCPPQQWVHNLQHGSVAFLYHPCVHPKLKEAFVSLARRHIAKHIITPLCTLSRDRPLALAAWCSTLEMSHINRTEVIGWLKQNVYIDRQYNTEEDGSYQHLLLQPSAMTSGETSRYLQVVNYLAHNGSRLRWHSVKRRRRRFVLPVTSLVPGTVHHVSHSATSSPPAGPQAAEPSDNPTSIVTLSVTANISSLPNPVTPGPTVYLPLEAVGSKADIHSRGIERNSQAEMPELPADNTVPTAGSTTIRLPEQVPHPVRENVSLVESHPGNEVKSQRVPSPESKQSKESASTVIFPTPTRQTQGESDPQLSPPEKPLTDGNEKKQECRCQQDATVQLPAKAQRRLGASQQKSSGVFVSTPRTEEAKWAAASLIFLFALLTFSVLYTQIYKKFRKSRSLYWTPGSHSEEKESVASVIKRRLVQGYSIRKKWIGRKKSPVVLYESLSDSSD